MRGLESRIAVVTGGAGGIGEAVTRRLVAEGVRVLIADLDAAAAHTLAEELCADGAVALGVGVDVRSREEVDALPIRCAEEWGAEPHVVVANAGHQTFAGILDIPEKEWHDVLDVNAQGTYLTMRAAAESFRRSGTTGSVVAVASIQARLGSVWYAHYSASKAAVLSLTRSFALELAASGCRANAVAPGVVDTALWAKADAAMAEMRMVAPGVPKAERIATVPLGRGGTPDDVASAVAFLASDEAAYVTGECLHVCGGDLML